MRAIRGYVSVSAVMLGAVLLLGCPPPGAEAPPTASEAEEFLAAAEAEFLAELVAAERAAWVQQNFITFDTDLLASAAEQRYIATTVRLAKQATRFDGLDLPDEADRKLKALKLALSKPAPDDPAKQQELTEATTAIQSRYGKGEYCVNGDCRDLPQLSAVMAESREPVDLLDAWAGWRRVSPPMRDDYRTFVNLANEGARELGFADLGAMWRSKYDMDPDAFAAEVDRLWEQVRPLYEALHCHVRARLNDYYGDRLVPENQPIPAHLLGNMWAQSWGNVYDLVGPKSGGDPGYDLSALLRERGVDEVEMVRIGERFFTSLGLDPLPETFWERSLFKQPPDREVVCHASAWDVDADEDLRIKMCIKIDAEDFVTVHHELGHNYYQRAYNTQPPLFRDSANDGFHEGLGDTLALSITPEYLVKIGMLERAPGAEGDLGLLLKQALDKVAFLPFGLLIDQWRWKVFSGEIPPERYNEAWWELRRKYQGIRPPIERSEADFDPGAKYHIPFNTPYTRYFLAHILQFQFHRALCEQIGFDGPLHRCSIYGDEGVGEKLDAMMKMGSSRPWPDALEALTGAREMDAEAILDYFAPLKTWLDEQNEGRTCGW